MMINPAFPKEELEREKGVVIQELKMYEDNPIALVMDKRQRYYFGDNSYGRPTIGTEENIKSFNQKKLFTHQADLYTKDNLIISIAGKIQDEAKVQQQLEETFSTLPEKKKISKPPFIHILPTDKVAFYDKKTEQNHLVISAPGFDGNNEHRYAANVLATILGGNMSSRLFQNVREKQGLRYYILAKHSSNIDT